MGVYLLILFYLITAVWIILDSRLNSGKAPATERFGAILWGSTGAQLIGFVIVAWWFIKSFVGTFLQLAVDWDITPTRSETSNAKEWLIFPQQLIAFGFTGNGDFEWTT